MNKFLATVNFLIKLLANLVASSVASSVANINRWAKKIFFGVFQKLISALIISVSLPAIAAEPPSVCLNDNFWAACQDPLSYATLQQLEGMLGLYKLALTPNQTSSAQRQHQQWLQRLPNACQQDIRCWRTQTLQQLTQLNKGLNQSLNLSSDTEEIALNNNDATLRNETKTLSAQEVSRFATPINHTKLDGTQIYSLAQQASVFMMGSIQGQPNRKIYGSGVILEPNLVVTNYHVVRKATGMVVLYRDRAYAFKVIAGDVGLDLVLLSVPGLPGSRLPLAPLSSIHPGQRVYAFGNPYGFTQSISDGIISAIRPHFVSKTAKIIQTTTPISSGSSGGGLFDEYGALLGLTTASFQKAQNLNFAIPAEFIKTLPSMTLF